MTNANTRTLGVWQRESMDRQCPAKEKPNPDCHHSLVLRISPNNPTTMTYHNAKYLAACAEKLGREMTPEEIAKALDCLADESGKELRQIDALFFGGFLEDTPKTGIAWRVFDEVMVLKKERDELRRTLDSQNAKSAGTDASGKTL
jgi:hypothetical protein